MSTNLKPVVQVFYAVVEGHKPGVYSNADLALRQTEGFPGGVVKRFNSWDEADACVKKSVFYAVVVGRKPGVYTDVLRARSQTDGWGGGMMRRCSCLRDHPAVPELDRVIATPAKAFARDVAKRMVVALSMMA